MFSYTKKMNQQDDMYLIKLDGIDLNYLKTSFKTPNGKVMPLWNRSSLDMGRNEYYEFKFCSDKEINANEEDDENDVSSDNDSEVEDLIYTPCCICDIDVPTTFLNEHYDSTKHKVNLKIAYTALDRVKKSVNIITKNPKKYNSLYFCPVCVVAVDVKEKKSHNKSTLHKNAVKLEKLFEEFSSLYAKDSEDVDTDVSEAENEVDKAIKKIVNKNYESKSIKKLAKTDKIIEKANPVKENKTKITHEVEKNEKMQINKKENENIDLLENALTDNYKKLMMHFDTVPSDTNKIDNIELESDNIEDLSLKNNYKSKTNENLKHTDKNSATDKKENVKNEKIEIIDTKTDVNSLSFRTHHHLEVTLFYVYCKVCKNNINVKELDHLKDLKHEINYEKFLEENSLYRTDSKHIECKICNISFICENEILHCDEIRHITNCERFKKKNVGSTLAQN